MARGSQTLHRISLFTRILRTATLHIQRRLVMMLAAWLALLLACCAPPDGGPSTPGLEVVMAQTEREYPMVHHATTDKVEQWLNDPLSPPMLLDVREEEEFAVSHLRGAVNVNPGALAQGVMDKQLKGINKNRRIVTYCSVGLRSAKLAKRLQEAGFTNVHNLNGSIFLWANEGKPIYRGQVPVSVVHPYDRTWGKLLKPELRDERAGN